MANCGNSAQAGVVMEEWDVVDSFEAGVIGEA